MVDDSAELTGTVEEVLPNSTFRVKLADGREILAHVGGKMRRNYAQIARGDRVAVELSAHEPSRGRITNRFR